MPILSVIIPVYNAQAYLVQCLGSVLNQSLKDIEVICVDDGSTDDSREIIRSFVSRDDRVKLLCQENQHAGVARNNGLAIAKGEYVHFLDADDYVADYAYESLVGKARHYDLDCLRCCAIAIDEHGNTVDNALYQLDRLRESDFERVFSEDDMPRYIDFCVTPWTGIYRRAFLVDKSISFNNLTCVNDRSFFVRVMTSAQRVMACHDRLVLHRVNVSESLINNRAKNFECQIASIRMVEEQLLKDAASADVFERVMQAEMTDLLVWCQRFASDPQWGSMVLDLTSSYIEASPYEFAREHKDRLRAIKEVVRNQAKKGGYKRSTKPKKVCYKRAEKPLISVVVPVPSGFFHLDRTLHSLTAQIADNLEFVCVGTPSDDVTRAMLREYAELDGRFCMLEESCGTLGEAISHGMAAARGSYVMILEAGDYLPNNMLQVVSKHIDEAQAYEAIVCGVTDVTVLPNGSCVEFGLPLASNGALYGHAIRPQDERVSLCAVVELQGAAISREFLAGNDVSFDSTATRVWHQGSVWHKMFEREESVLLLDGPRYQRCFDEGQAFSEASGILHDSVDNRLPLLDRLVSWHEQLQDFGLHERFGSDHAEYMVQAVVLCLQTCQPKDYQQIFAWLQKEIQENDQLDDDMVVRGVGGACCCRVSDLRQMDSKRFLFALKDNMLMGASQLPRCQASLKDANAALKRVNNNRLVDNAKFSREKTDRDANIKQLKKQVEDLRRENEQLQRDNDDLRRTFANRVVGFVRHHLRG